MSLILRKFHADGVHHGFKWPLSVGSVVECADWDIDANSYHGFHGLYNGNGMWNLLIGDLWGVLNVDDKDIVFRTGSLCKFRSCEILYVGGKDGMSKYSDMIKEDEGVLCWAYFIGDKDKMIHLIKNSYMAVHWACHIGDQEVMYPLISKNYHCEKKYNALKLEKCMFPYVNVSSILRN